MVSPISTSLAGLQVANKRFEVAANNIANQNSTSTRNGAVVTDDAYKPQRVIVTNEGGTPTAKVDTIANPTQKLYQPDHPQADDSGFVEVPNSDTARDLVELKIASYDAQANLKAIKVQNNIMDALLDIIT